MSSRVFVLALGTMQSLSVGMGIHVNNRVLIIKNTKKLKISRNPKKIEKSENVFRNKKKFAFLSGK